MRVDCIRVIDCGGPNPFPSHIGIPSGAEWLSRVSAVYPRRETAFHAIRDALVGYLACAFCGDVVAAEFLLLALVGRPDLLSSAVSGASKLSRNIIFLNRSDVGLADDVIAALEALLPAVVRFYVTADALSAEELYPKSDCGRLRARSARLQLLAGSLLVLDETAFTVCELEGLGAANLRALSLAAKKSTLPIDEDGFESEVPLAANVLVLSASGRSIIPTDPEVRVFPARPGDAVPSWRAYDEGAMESLRSGLAHLVDSGDFAIPAETRGVINGALMGARHVSGANSEHALRVLVMARLAAQSFGERILSVERWNYTVALELGVRMRRPIYVQGCGLV
jgi:hypothetical protein